MPLPDILKFLYPGWWMVHVVAVWVAFQFGFTRGKAAARREQHVREVAQGR